MKLLGYHVVQYIVRKSDGIARSSFVRNVLVALVRVVCALVGTITCSRQHGQREQDVEILFHRRFTFATGLKSRRPSGGFSCVVKIGVFLRQNKHSVDFLFAK